MHINSIYTGKSIPAPSFHWAERIEINMAVLHVIVSCGYFFFIFFFTLTPSNLHVGSQFANIHTDLKTKCLSED